MHDKRFRTLRQALESKYGTDIVRLLQAKTTPEKKTTRERVK